MDILANFIYFMEEQLLLNGMNMFNLSKKVGVNDQVMSRWISKQYLPSFENLIIADYFNVSIDYMLGLTDLSSFIRLNPPQPFIPHNY